MGAGTILDYVGLASGDVGMQFRKAFPADHLALLQRTVPLYEQGPLLVTHDGRANNICGIPEEPEHYVAGPARHRR